MLPDRGAVLLRVLVAEPDADDGRREISVYSRPEDVPDEQAWTRHATGVLVRSAEPAGFDARSWPPTDAEPVELADFYRERAELGLGYGPVFQGLRAVWRRGGELFAEVALPEGDTGDTSGFGLHPALLDAALHCAGPDGAQLPLAWTGVSLYAVGATALRVALSPAGDGYAVRITDVEGAPVASIASVTWDDVAAERLAEGAGRRESLYGVDWVASTPTTTLTPAPVGPEGSSLVVLGGDGLGVAAVPGADVMDLEALKALYPTPEVVVLPVPDSGVVGVSGGVRGSHMGCWRRCVPGWLKNGSPGRGW